MTEILTTNMILLTCLYYDKNVVKIHEKNSQSFENISQKHFVFNHPRFSTGAKWRLPLLNLRLVFQMSLQLAKDREKTCPYYILFLLLLYC